jgi:hypothetical protein
LRDHRGNCSTALPMRTIFRPTSRLQMHSVSVPRGKQDIKGASPVRVKKAGGRIR